ncbi:MAG: hypothetical protein AB7P08_00695 [Burkholderiales bacterium]
MPEPSLPSYAGVVMVLVIIANLATGWVVLLTMGVNGGSLFSGGPPAMVGISCVALALCHYNILIPLDVSFWGATLSGALGLWGAWVDYSHLSDRREAVRKSLRRDK